MFKVIADRKANQLIMILAGHFSFKDAEDLYRETCEILPEVQRGFSCRTDLSLLTRMDPKTRFVLEKLMDLLNENGVSKVIRIIPDQSRDIGFNIMSLFHYSEQVAIHTFKSMEEAEKHFM